MSFARASFCAVVSRSYDDLARGLALVRGAGGYPGLAGFALGLLVMAIVPPAVQRWGSPAPDDAQFVGSHVRALQIGPLDEVASSDRRTVKPWFQGKLAYARNRHMIDLYVWPSAQRVVPVSSVHRGYNLVHWADGAMQYWVVSDLERREL